VVVVDDGSNDETPQYLESLGRQGRIKTVRNHTSRGPSAARNLGVQHASGDFVLIMGDDVLVEEDMTDVLQCHINTHDMSLASVIGNIQPWPEEMTPFEFWLSNGGSQFAHYRIQERDALDAGECYFYTTNVVTPRSLLLQFPFDESFPYARYEDRELGYRLKRQVGHKIHYRKDALSYHFHKLPFKEWLIKFDHFAWAAIHFSNLYPEDGQLHKELGRRKAEQLQSFSYPVLLESVDIINRYNSYYFSPDNVYGTEWIREVVGRGFRTVQDFFRMNYYRKHLQLNELSDAENRITATEAMQTILGKLNNDL
jgi:glycosyltransferase involved in cell wall biosynthesis